jgi:hypothetical protein
VTSCPLTIIVCEFKGKSGAGGMPPLPLRVKPFVAPDSRSLRQAWAVVFSGSTGVFGNSVAPRTGLIPGGNRSLPPQKRSLKCLTQDKNWREKMNLKW